jgi:Bifunctional DNA primase/polymerase, N-terminal
MMTDEPLSIPDECSPPNTFEDILLDSKDPGSRQDPENAAVYGRGAWTYREAGWPGVLPVPPRAKFPPPTGYTGHDGRWPTPGQIDEWGSEKPDSNLILRVDYGIIGVDVDAYDDETGAQTLNEAETRWGSLPPTFRSSARHDDQTSGIRVFRAPAGVLFRSSIEFRDQGLGDIEIIQPHHRYITAWPSIHPKIGQQYRWYGPDGALLPEGQVPKVDDIPELPEPWVLGLSKDSVREEFFDGSAPNRPREEDAVVDEAVYDQLSHLEDNGAPDDVVAAKLQRALLELTNGAGCRYDITRDCAAALMRYHFWGRPGVPRALTELFLAYVMEVSDTRPHRVAAAEFKRFTEGAALLIAADRVSDPWSTLGMGSPEPSVDGFTNDKGAPDQDWDSDRMVTGGAFVLDEAATIESLWGSGEKIIWPDGEGLMLTGTQGVGKTTLAQHLSCH